MKPLVRLEDVAIASNKEIHRKVEQPVAIFVTTISYE